MPNTVQAMTALHYAVQRKNFDIAKMLVEKGADINAKAKYGLTAFHYAAAQIVTAPLHIQAGRGWRRRAKWTS